jgi:hypothetical protein
MPIGVFFPALIYIAVALAVIFCAPLCKAERFIVASTLGFSTALNVSSVNFYGGGADDFYYYLETYNQIFEANGFDLNSDYFPKILDVNLEIVLNIFFYALSVTMKRLNVQQLAFFITLLIFYLYYLGIFRILGTDEKRNRKQDFILFISLIGIGNIIFYQLPRQGLAGAFILLALAGRRPVSVISYFLLSVATHFSSLFIAPLLFLLRSKYSTRMLFVICGATLYILSDSAGFQLVFTSIPKMDYYLNQASWELSSSMLLNGLLTVLAFILYLIFRSFGSPDGTPQRVFSVIGGWQTLLFMLVLFSFSFEITLFFDRVGLLFITFLVWVYIGLFSVSLNSKMLSAGALIGAAILKSYQVLGGSFFFYDVKWFEVPLQILL